MPRLPELAKALLLFLNGIAEELLNFYKCYRVYVQDKVGNSQLDDPHDYQEEKTKVLATARNYCEFAESYTEWVKGNWD